MASSFVISFYFILSQSITDEPMECSICLEALQGTDQTTLECSHTFHNNCINDWIKVFIET